MSAKIVSKEAAVSRIHSGMSLMVGGFGLVGCPLVLVDEVLRQGQTDLTVISNNVGEPGKGLSRLLEAGRIRKVIGSYFSTNPTVGSYYRMGLLEVELLPQGTFAEAIRAGGAGIGGFYTPAGVGTLLAERKETRVMDGREFVLERPLRADVALIRAHRADKLGNLVYRKTARNFNPMMATAADLVIAEVDEIVEVGELDPETIVTPHLYVDLIVPRGEAGD
ncbi:MULTISPECIES: CoA transferase subunit A [Kyrpidia]|uniref:Acetoacetyl CoA-transferase (Subunit A) n=2 Tax=Kyrpidia spormannii TaxID=2055160 RepID=A0A6F9E2L8_9BACL|nr:MULTISPECIES: CoA transferase subunit A [Kyrpidia]MCL6576414.1 CoA transferase subunit A [Kyrpidia sp.]CAB3390656.1 acetoacetyl CoA-transferase (subunit A) [Kyrpidia spormannii]CAB3391572.1 acetoacetyl CoA-transferase (subunit A) [Kyrpidia spormannii]HHY66558.1 CoA transferase subunit A [Alicyclobacillus sp.]